MSIFDTASAVKSIDQSELAKIAAQLNSTGFVTDEDGLAFGSNIIEHWSSQCDQLLIANGYTGGKLGSTGKHFTHCGAIYVLYDKRQHNLADAISQLQLAANRHPKP